MPLISVIIPSYNYSQFIISAVKSALAQEKVDCEVIVVDDGSTDNTKQLLEEYIPKISYVYQKNKGLSAARNTGIKIAKGEFIALLDADDIWLLDKLRLQLELISNARSIGIVGCSGFYVDEKGTQIDKFKRKEFSNQRLLFKQLLKKNIISGGSEALVRRECFGKVGYFDESLKSAEDWDMWLRIARYYEVKFIDKPLVNIRVRQNSMSGTTNAAKMLENELRVLDKLFKSNDVKFNWYIRNRSYCYRYFCAAWAFLETGKLSEARKLIWKALTTNPVYFLASKDCLALLMKTSFAKKDKNE